MPSKPRNATTVQYAHLPYKRMRLFAGVCAGAFPHLSLLEKRKPTVTKGVGLAATNRPCCAASSRDASETACLSCWRRSSGCAPGCYGPSSFPSGLTERLRCLGRRCGFLCGLRMVLVSRRRRNVLSRSRKTGGRWHGRRPHSAPLAVRVTKFSRNKPAAVRSGTGRKVAGVEVVVRVCHKIVAEFLKMRFLPIFASEYAQTPSLPVLPDTLFCRPLEPKPNLTRYDSRIGVLCVSRQLGADRATVGMAGGVAGPFPDADEIPGARQVVLACAFPGVDPRFCASCVRVYGLPEFLEGFR